MKVHYTKIAFVGMLIAAWSCTLAQLQRTDTPQCGGLQMNSLDLATLTPLPQSLAEKAPDSELLWYNASHLPIKGKGWEDTETPFERLSSRWKDKTPDAVWSLGKHTAGLAIHFVTNSKSVAAIWDGGGAMNHMAATGNSGLDLYTRQNGQWKFKKVGKPKTERTLAVLVSNGEELPTEYLLYLPLYNSVTELKLGIEPDAFLASPPNRPKQLNSPVVFYGTSITQGGCASRAGMCHPAIVGRWLEREVINLGFSGAGKMEPEMAEMIGELDPAVFVLDCLPNMTVEMVRERVVPFVKILRKTRPSTPVLLVELPHNHQNNVELSKAYETLLNQGVKNLRLMTGENLLAGKENGTVDGTHPTDLGFFRMAEAFHPVLKEILASAATR